MQSSAIVVLVLMGGMSLAIAKSRNFQGKRARDDFMKCHCDTNYEPVCNDLGDAFYNQCIAECEGVFTFTHADINGECEPVEEEKRGARKPMLSWSAADDTPVSSNGRRPQMMKVNAPVEEEKRGARKPMFSWSAADDTPVSSNGRRPTMKVNVPVEEEKRGARKPSLSWSAAEDDASASSNGRRPQLKVNDKDDSPPKA